jgi:hypothetical protein
MTVYWSATTSGFYHTDYFPEADLPTDAVEISDEDYKVLLDAQSAGQVIVTDPDTGGAMAVDPIPPEQTLAQQAAAMMAAPVTVDCATAVGVTATYANNAEVRGRATTVVSQINAGLGLPGGGATFNWPDIDNTQRDWPEAEFKSLAKALADYTYELQQVVDGFSDILPSNTLSI